MQLQVGVRVQWRVYVYAQQDIMRGAEVETSDRGEAREVEKAEVKRYITIMVTE